MAPWSEALQPLLGAAGGAELLPPELAHLLARVVDSESEFKKSDESTDIFYTSLAILTTHYVAANHTLLNPDIANVVRDACRIAVQHILKKISDEAILKKLTEENKTVSENTFASTFSVIQLLSPIAELYDADIANSSHSNYSVILGHLKNALPPNSATEKNNQTLSGQADKISTHRRSDNLGDLLTNPLQAYPSAMSLLIASQGPTSTAVESTATTAHMETVAVETGTTTAAPVAKQPAFDGKKWLSELCLSLLRTMRAGVTLLDLCGSLPCLQRYLTRVRAARDSTSPICQYHHYTGDSSLVHALSLEVSICQAALALPCYEPLTAARITLLSDISAAWLLCATIQVSVHQKDEEENLAGTLVEGALCLFSIVGETLMNSTWAGGFVFKNHLMIGTWILLGGLHQVLMGGGILPGVGHMSMALKSPARTSAKTYNICRTIQGMNVMWVALGARFLECTRTLLADARLESQMDGDNNTQTTDSPNVGSLDPLYNNTATQRVGRLTICAPLHQMLVVLGAACYRKATGLKRAVVQKQHEQDADRSDSTVYYQDMIMCSEDSETDDEDSEPLLGLWFESTLVAPDVMDSCNTGNMGGNDGQEGGRGTGLVPDKAEPYSYISLGTEVFSLLESEVLGCGSHLSSAVYQLQESSIVLLSVVIKDLDRETGRTDTGTISPCFGTRLGKVYADFSAVLTRYLHLLSSSAQFVDQRQILLEQLDVAPPLPGELTGLVPLQVGCRALKLLGAVILSKPVSERELTILALWTKTIYTIVECAIQAQPPQDYEYEDINVEHSQLLIYLFHSLNLMQKKSVLLMTANAIIKVSNALGIADHRQALHVGSHQLIFVTRLLLLLEYIMKHLYDPPPCLLQQIKWNLVLSPGIGSNEPQGALVTRQYCSVPHIEQAYRRRMTQDIDYFMRPKFYALINTDINNQETPKLDGLACNFILGTPDKLKYPLLLDGLLNLLGCIGICDRRPTSPLSSLCASHYCFQTVWRFLITLPPSTPHMEQVALGSTVKDGQACTETVPLNSLIWAPRANNAKTFGPWLKDALVKQGMYTQYAENLLSSVSNACDNISFTVWLAIKTIQQLRDNIPVGGMPCLLDVINVDCVIMRLRVSLCDETQVTALATANMDTQLTNQFMPHLLDLLETLFIYCRDCVVRESTPTGLAGLDEIGSSVETISDIAIEAVFQCCGARGAPWLRAQLPQAARSALDKANSAPSCLKPPTAFLNDAIPSESAILQLVLLHCQLISGNGGAAPALRLLALGAVELLAARVSSLLEPGCETDKDRAISLLLPAVVDGRLQFLQETAFGALTKLLPTPQKVEQMLHEEVLKSTYSVMVANLSLANEKILRGMVKCWEKILEKSSGRSAFEELFAPERKSLGEALMNAPNANQPYCSRVIRLFNKLFNGCESSENPPSPLCISICQHIGSSPGITLTSWLRHICLGSVASAHTASTPSDSDAATPTVPPVATPATITTTIINPAAPKQESGNEGSNNSSPAPRNGQSDTAQQSESYSWCGGGSDSKESVAIPLSETADNSDNAMLLSNLTKHMIMHCDESACMNLLMALVPLVSESLNSSHGGLPLPRLLREATQLADSHTGDGHKILFPTAMQWLKTCVDTLSSPDMLERIEDGGGQRSLLEAACHLLAYLTDALHAGSGEEAAPAGGLPPLSWDTPTDISLDAEWPDDQQDEEDTSADDSDEDSMLHLKLCTFMTTAREFMNQHWYHCHTCKMVEGIGVCTVCALVCHRNHDVSYAKYGNFFCDCGAKEESTCQALVKRSSSQSHMLNKRGACEGDQAPPPSLRRRPSSPLRTVSPPPTRQPAYATNLSGVRDWIFGFEGWTECLQALQMLLEALPGPVRLACERHAPVGRHGRGRRALAQLHHGDKRFHTTDQLMVPTLGSQEGAFENVRMSYTGEQGQTIRQLISAHIVRRVAMCCLALPHGRRQHLVVSHEKGKITIYQLSALLKQADSSKRKLTLTRLTSIPIPFTVLSLSGNPWNEDLLAVCGLRECHVITFTITGSTYERLVLQPSLDTGNFIIRSIWLPGTQTQLALVTADFIKIYDLSKDVTLPQYHFLVPSGKVRDVTFINQENATYMLCMGNGGHIYWQPMNDESHASNGPFYVTNTLEVFHSGIKDATGQVGGGGVSIYYSHTLKILFFSYAHGKSFLVPLTSVEETLRGVSLITVGSGSGSQKEGGGRSKGAQSLCQWQEVPAHPGLVTAVLQASNNPVVLMLKPGSIAVQEIKVVPVKAKITDMVTVRHASGQQELKTTLILLCEDGSLRIYAASPDQTGYWLSPTVAPPFVSPYMERTRRPRHIVRNKTPQSTTKPGGAPVFPIDFFENCVALDDVEFGGNDLLQVYNTAQIKHRLNTNGLFVVSTKLSGFTLEITNPDASTVITGIRVLLGNQDIARTPSFIEVCGRTIQTLGQRNRWYDIPLSREESLQADKKLSVTFTCSQDPEGVIMVDSVKVYGRNKEVFGWPEENEDGPCASANKNAKEADTNTSGSWRAAGVERLACAVLEVLELALGTSGPGVGSVSARVVATKILCLPSPPPLHARCKALLKAILGPQYHQHKDQAILTHIIDELIELQQTTDGRNIDPENFFRLLLLARAIAVSRPLNLVKYAGPLPIYQHTPGENMCTWMEGLLSTAEMSQHLAPLLANVLWVLSCVRQPDTPLALSPVDRCGLRHPAHALQALVDILHAFMMHSDQVDLGNRIYVSLLLDDDQVISFGAKSAIVRVLRPRVKRRRVYIPSPPTTPGISGGTTVPMEASRAITPPAESSDQAQDHSDSDVSHYADVDQVVDMSRLLMAETSGLEALLDIHPDADDETMVELAIALSLQERSAGTSVSLAVGSGAPSDTTASAAASDDEEASGVVGALPAISPADLPTSESGSGADSIGGISGRSSTYGETGVRVAVDIPTGTRWAQDTTFGTETATRLSFLRLSLLNVLLDELPQLRKIRGHRSIPFMQVLLMLVTALDASVESDRLALQRFLDVIIAELHLDGTDDSTEPPECRTSHREMQLLIMRLLSVLMSRWKPTVTTIVPLTAPSTSRATATASATGAVAECHAARAAAGALLKCGAVERCRVLLKALLPYWREQGANSTPEGSPASTHSQLLRPQPPHPLPDMQPFFLRHYVKGHAWDVMENYPHLLTEMALRLPYKIHKHCDQPAPTFNDLWHPLLCEYMMNQQTPFLRKQVRKLLLMMCGTKEKYRQLRDVHALNTHMEGVHEFVESLDPSYDSNVQLMDHLKACVEIVVARTGNWQYLCSVQAPNTLSYLMVAACNLEEGVAPTVLQLLQCALCPPVPPASTTSKPSTQASNERTERERSADSEASTTANSKFQEQIVPQLVQQIQLKVHLEEFRHFIRTFLLETNSTAVRWQAHALMLAIYENSVPIEQIRLVNLVWGLWPALPQYGRKAAQFVDLLGYFSLKTPNINLEDHLSAAVNLLRTQNNVLLSHGNAPIYSALSNYVELDGYFLESEPCLVCNNPEVPMATIKLSTIRIDSKFTTTTQIVKLVSSHTISHIGLRISDLKRSKMVRAINVSYNNRTVQAVQELKNKPGMWHKAKHVVLQSGQTEVRIDFPLPIVACNLMMEYADFYENAQTSGESLQCPRCSAAVPANPGVCANCGENVFQCHRCRAINYDEKDPFLCHACGFCKYAKFDYTLTARPCCAVDTIENDEDRKKMVATIRTLLDKADRVYRQLVANKPLLENLLHKISEQRTEGNTRGSGEDGATTGSTGNSNTQVNRVIQSLAHKYCVDSKNLFDELSKVIQRVLTCRRELVSYDKLQSEQLEGDVQPSYTAMLQNESKIAEGGKNNCYGCALSAASHCLTLLRALASSPEHRQKLCQLGLVQELVQHNLRRGSLQSQDEVRQLICVVTRDNFSATKELCKLLTQRITLGLVGHAAAQDHTNAVRPLVLLLGGLVKVKDSIECWEARLKCIVRLWIWCCPYLSNMLSGVLPLEEGDASHPPLTLPPSAARDSHALQQVALPCLQYLHHLMQSNSTVSKDKPTETMNETLTSPPMSGAVLDLGAWLSGKVSFADWKRIATPQDQAVGIPETASIPLLPSDDDFKDNQLAYKYTSYWREKVLRIYGLKKLCLGDGGWLRPVMFNPSSKMARDTACQMVKSLCTGYERTKAIIVLLTSFLPEIGVAGEASEQFLQLYQSLASDAPWKQFLALRGVLSLLAELLTKEINHLHKLEETTLTSDLAQGYALKRLTELLAMFLEDGGVRRAYKGRLMGAVLGGYLSLRRLVVQRTRLIDDTQEKLLELLEEMTTGTEAETAEFMAVCIETVAKYPLYDFRTPVFIFERLCSIIYPEENDVREFFLTLEKDPQQEDFLQGRMLGNPYSSLEPGLGPLMRDVKNKICADCELVALLEDDTGMELLVNNKIMSLDLPVKDVYKKVWAVSGEGDAMRVVYRMRGLLGDATEEFVETLNASSVEAVDDEQLYKMANVLADCGGMEVMLERLAAAGGAGGAARPLARTLLRLLSLCARARRCVAVLTQPSTGSLPALLRALQLAATDEATRPRPELTYQLLEIMDRILSVAAGESLESFLQFSLTFGGPEYVQALLNCTECPGIRNNQEALSHLTRVLAALVYGNELKMAHLCQHFKRVLDFNKFDSERWAEDEFRLELFCVLCSGIERNTIGGTLKDYFISLGIVKDALDYITIHAPCVKPTLLRTDSDELKEFIAKPALKYILRFLTGLAADHEPTQMAVCEKVIPIVHRLEQVSSDEHVGSLAENLLEALMSEPEAARIVQEARDYTRHEKKRLAMAMREKQLGALGMRTNDKGQVTAQCSLTQQVQELGEEVGAVCCICREGYKYQPTKVLGIYTFTKRCGVEEYEVKARKTTGYTTVTHYNVVHVECHTAAVRLARTRDEWESAALQNASTKCNGLLPLWGPHVPESAFAGCLARHNTYLQESTGHRDIGYTCTIHDLKLLLLRFAREKQFHEDTGGGGPLSNMQLVPCLMHMALYVINTTRVAARELANIQTYLEWTVPRQLESAHDAEGPLYYAVLAMLLQPRQIWKEERLEHLRRLLLIAQVRSLIPSGPPLRVLEADQKEPRSYEDFKPYLIFFSLIQLIYDVMLKSLPATVDQWPVKLAETIRHGDETILRNSEKILAIITEELLPCTSFAEWCDAAGLLPFIPNPDEFLASTLNR